MQGDGRAHHLNEARGVGGYKNLQGAEPERQPLFLEDLERLVGQVQTGGSVRIAYLLKELEQLRGQQLLAEIIARFNNGGDEVPRTKMAVWRHAANALNLYPEPFNNGNGFHEAIVANLGCKVLLRAQSRRVDAGVLELQPPE